MSRIGNSKWSITFAESLQTIANRYLRMGRLVKIKQRKREEASPNEDTDNTSEVHVTC